MKEERLLRVGVLGAGPIAQAAHFESCLKARNVELYAICEVAEDLLARMAATFQPRRTFTDYAAMLDDPELEAVIVATSDAFHVEASLAALAAGKHVLCEKPMAMSVESAEKVRAAVERSGRVFHVGHMKRYDAGITAARDFIMGEIGQLLALKAWYCDSTHRYTVTDAVQPFMVRSAAARRPGEDPRADLRRYLMLAHGSHLVDTARFLAGEITAVRARCSELHGSYCWFIEADLANGALAHLELTIPVRGDFEEGFRIYGEHGSIQGKVFLPWYHKASVVECFSEKTREYRRPLGEDAYTYKLQIESFAQAILHGAPQRGAGIDDGVAAMRAMVAIARSAETGEKVHLCDVKGGV